MFEELEIQNIICQNYCKREFFRKYDTSIGKHGTQE